MKVNPVIAAGKAAETTHASSRSKLPDGLVNIKLSRNDLDARIYKIVDGRELQLHIFYPKGYATGNKRMFPVAASFHGGSWREGPIEWGHGDAKFMASLGFVGIAVEYRLADYSTVSVLDCIRDANSVPRWIRINAEPLQIDPKAVFVIGHSSGGHLCLCTALFPDLLQSGEPIGISSKPNAVIALAPAVKLEDDPDFTEMLLNQISAKECSPSCNIRRLEMPVLILHGTNDEALDIAETREFTRKMKAVGNNMELKEYEGGDHGFFYGDPEGIKFWTESVKEFVGRVLSPEQKPD